MSDISANILYWIACCNDVWCKWFEGRTNGADDYQEVEEVLFRLLVTRSLNLTASSLTVHNLHERLRVRYLDDSHESRQACVVQERGTVFCTSEVVMMKKGVDYTIRTIDSMGTMMDSEPYVEVVVGNRFVLESPRNLRFLMYD